jgi:hypothetical protein
MGGIDGCIVCQVFGIGVNPPHKSDICWGVQRRMCFAPSERISIYALIVIFSVVDRTTYPKIILEPWLI